MNINGEITRRTFSRAALATAALAVLPTPAGAALADDMHARARVLLDGMSSGQQSDAVLSMKSDDRTDWHFTPRSRPGVAIKAMSEVSRQNLRALLETVFSAQGMAKADGVRNLEQVLYDAAFFSSFRDPLNYAVVFFGAPSAENAWAWRYEGHHISISVTVVPGQGVAATPAFFGANPQTVAADHKKYAGLRILEAEEDLAFRMIQGLSGAARDAAILKNHDLDDIVAGPGRETALKRIDGLAVLDMGAAGRSLAENLLNAYVANMTREIAAQAQARVREAGWDALKFGWAGGTEKGQPHYYRLHGPTALIEYDNSRGSSNHVHSVWHDPTNLFGEDMLRKHYAGGGH